jgi:hypothetical protein
MITIKLVKNFDKIEGVPVNPVITTLLIQIRDITRIYEEAGEEYDSTWSEVFEKSLLPALTVEALLYRFEADEDYTEAEGDAVNGLIELMLNYGFDLFHASAILSNMKMWNAEYLNNWIRKKEQEFEEL